MRETLIALVLGTSVLSGAAAQRPDAAAALLKTACRRPAEVTNVRQ
jgi:hypothetical protein